MDKEYIVKSSKKEKEQDIDFRELNTRAQLKVLKDEIDTEVMPIIYPCEVERNMIPLYQLHES